MALEYAIHVRPTDYLKTPADTALNWIQLADPSNDGLCIEVTGYVPAADVNVPNACSAIETIAAVIEHSSQSNPRWKVTSEGGSKAVSMPQRGIEPGTTNIWFLNLCCLQSTLGQIAAQIFSHPHLEPFRTKMFPYLEFPYVSGKDNLGAWQIALNPSPSPPLTQTQALALRSRIIEEIESWTVCLMVRNVAAVPPPPTLQCPAAADLPAKGLLHVANIRTLPLSLYPPAGEKCDQENSRPIGPFPPGSCVPPLAGNGSCYFPVKNYPDCCFRRANYPLLR